MNNLTVKFEFTVDQINTILKYLGSGMYSEVADLINIIHAQASSQLQAASAPATDAAGSDTPPNQSE